MGSLSQAIVRFGVLFAGVAIVSSCDKGGGQNADWYGFCEYSGGYRLEFTLYDLGKPPEGSQLLSSVGEWKTLEGTADVSGENSRSDGVNLLSATCLTEEGCNLSLVPYQQHERLFDMSTLQGDLGGEVVLKGMPDNPKSPNRYTGECSHSVRSGRGQFVLQREPLPPKEEPAAPPLPNANCPAADLATDDAHCGTCGNVCTAGGCLLGQCPEQRRRRQQVDISGVDGCAVHLGNVLSFPVAQTAPQNPVVVTMAYSGGDAIQAVLHEPYVCVLKTDGTTECIDHVESGNTASTRPPSWSNVLEIAGNGSSILAGVNEDGDLLWFKDPILPDIHNLEPRTGISRLGVHANSFTSMCWQEVAGPLVCKSSAQVDRQSFVPVLDFDGGRIVITEDGELSQLVGPQAAPQRLGRGDAVMVSEGNEVYCALINDGSVECWHRLGGGWAPNPDPNCDTLPSEPGNPSPCLVYEGGSLEHRGAVPGLNDATAIVSGVRTSCAARPNGTLLCWSGADLADSWTIDLNGVSP